MKHRATAPVDTRPARADFRPRHCAGDGCLHDHAGESAPLRGIMRLFRSAVPC